MGQEVYEKLMRCYKDIRSRTDFIPKVAIVLGSGLGDYAEGIRVECEVSYSELEGFPVSTVPGHAGKFIFVACMKGRVHYYEGYPVSDVVLPIRLLKLMGAQILFLTNAAGGVNTSFHAGDLMMIKDHISVFAPNPLIGPNIEELGTRFPDMSAVYDKELQRLLVRTAGENGIFLQEGVYAQLTGPSFESPADGDANLRRILYLQSCGWHVSQSPEPSGSPGSSGQVRPPFQEAGDGVGERHEGICGSIDIWLKKYLK